SPSLGSGSKTGAPSSPADKARCLPYRAAVSHRYRLCWRLCWRLGAATGVWYTILPTLTVPAAGTPRPATHLTTPCSEPDRIHSMDPIPASSESRAVAMARRVLRIEAEAVAALAERIGVEFERAVDIILKRHGRVIVTGIGKSGHIARKIAATLASTGTPAYFVHAAEAAHGDLGMITAQDVVIALSNSGSSEEVLTIVPLVKRQGARLIAMTGKADSPLAREADAHLEAAVAEEACPLNLAPTASTTAALALGDALAVALLDARGFAAEDFARSH